ncbi:MAG: type I-B CRISPR-associated protein Cas5 [Candidatus Omnitrophota bacterium]|nr:MAG: type I-B CRISPR-associated protein Cas5 [Candidatus Omnitrophota bacterium]
MMQEIERLLIFDIKGPVAHFRKFYTNSSSLSYSFPSRTTITGLIAGILGREKDKYYDEFSSDRCKIAVSIRTPVRKIMQTINYVRTKSLGELNLSAGHTQVPLEIVLPFESNELKYRIYFYHKDNTFDELKEVLEKEKFVYPPYLGISEFIADVKFVDFIKGEQIFVSTNLESSVEIVTVVNIEHIQKGSLVFKESSGEVLQYIKERMPLEFDSERKLKKGASFIYEKNQGRIKLKIKSYYTINYRDSDDKMLKENIVFMEA